MNEASLLHPDGTVIGPFAIVSRKDAPATLRHDTGEYLYPPGPLLEAELIGKCPTLRDVAFTLLIGDTESPVRVKLSQRLPGGSELSYLKVVAAE